MAGLSTAIAAGVKSKVALAVLGALLVGGSSAAAAAATHNGDIGPVHTPLFHKDNDQGNSDNAGDHAHTISVEGVLDSAKSCPSNVTSIVVTKASESGEHDVKDNDNNSSDANQSLEPTEKTTKPATGTETLTVLVNGKTKVNGEKDADGVNSLCGKAGHKVEIQAEKNSSGALVAWKVTLQGVENDKDDHSATPGANGNGGNSDHTSVDGNITSVGHSSFTVKDATGKTVTVKVDAQTVFSGRATTVSGLHSGEKVQVEGTKQADGSILATKVVETGN